MESYVCSVLNRVNDILFNNKNSALYLFIFECLKYRNSFKELQDLNKKKAPVQKQPMTWPYERVPWPIDDPWIVVE